MKPNYSNEFEILEEDGESWLELARALKEENELLRMAIGDNYGWVNRPGKKPLYWQTIDEALTQARRAKYET